MKAPVERGRGKYKSDPNDVGADASGMQAEGEPVTRSGQTDGEPLASPEVEPMSDTDQTEAETLKEVTISDILLDIPLPEEKPVTRRNKYPFADLPVKGAFFVCNVPLKTMVTNCSNQNKKYKEECRHYIARQFTREGVDGVMVWRTA